MEIGKHYTSESTKKSLRAGEKFFALPHTLSEKRKKTEPSQTISISSYIFLGTDTLLCIIALLWCISHLVLEKIGATKNYFYGRIKICLISPQTSL